MLTIYFPVYCYRAYELVVQPLPELWDNEERYTLHIKPHQVIPLFLFAIQGKSLATTTITEIFDERYFITATKALNLAYKETCKANGLRPVEGNIILFSPENQLYSVNPSFSIHSDWHVVNHTWHRGKPTEKQRAELVAFFDTYRPLFANYSNDWAERLVAANNTIQEQLQTMAS